ncbi:F-box-like domain protein [Rhizoctonia solani 123E]|uniref:F-box-like domain protein n=1 Tax=Rhizoctonia solani 123E TaxID=1423351 RepID=A0A074RRH0_9AGAM|nr:F-box-like domain protein [Rhizoctonia solani 123E]
MLEELHISSDLLCTVLDRYVNACSALRNGCLYRNNINSAAELLGPVTDEMSLVESYKSKITQAQVEVKRARNSLANVPINSLPAEVLAYIFRLVLAQQCCPLRAPYHWDFEDPPQIPNYPDTLSHVCSQWRYIALATPGLWSHIDIALSCPLSKGFHDRATTYVARAHQTPLDIHLIDPGYIRQVERSRASDDDSGSEQSFDSADQALEHCLANCSSGSLFELVIDVPNETMSYPILFETSSDLSPHDHASSTHLLLPKGQLENAWKSTTSLSLNGTYPSWSSTAYYGLTELRLLGNKDISGAELARILNSSPGLRILHCDFNIQGSPHVGTSSSLITLQELETLEISGMRRAGVEHFLRWLTTGPKHLRLSLGVDPTSALLKDFFTRSNVQEMRIETKLRASTEPELSPTMFCLPPQLKTLVITGWSWDGDRVMNTSTPSGPNNETLATIELDALYMLSCCFNTFYKFREVVAKFSPRKLVVWNCDIEYPASTWLNINLPYIKSIIGNDLSQLCPSVECLTVREPKPLQDWD